MSNRYIESINVLPWNQAENAKFLDVDIKQELLKCDGAANKPRKENARWGHEESLARLFMCQHVSIEAHGDRDKGVGVGGNRRAKRGSEGSRDGG